MPHSARSTRRPRGSSTAEFQQSRFSACLAAPLPAVGSCPFWRSSSDPRSRLLIELVPTSGSYRCRATAPWIWLRNSSIVQQHQCIRAPRQACSANPSAASSIRSRRDSLSRKPGRIMHQAESPQPRLASSFFPDAAESRYIKSKYLDRATVHISGPPTSWRLYCEAPLMANEPHSDSSSSIAWTVRQTRRAHPHL